MAHQNVAVISDSFSPLVTINPGKVVDNGAVARLLFEILQDFKKYGAVIHPSSRLLKYATLFSSNAAAANDESIHARLDVALLEGLQFCAIHRCILSAAQCPKLRRNLSIAAGGAVDATSDKDECKARSIQFELFVLSCLRAAGLNASLEEPDLLVHLPEKPAVAIAAKRPRSDKKIFKNIRNARRQISGSRRVGIVTVDLSFVESLAKPVYVERAEQVELLAKVVLDGFVLENEQKIRDAAQDVSVIGVLFHFSGVVRSTRDSARLVSRRWVFLQTQPAPANEEALVIMRGLQDLRRD
jgi:hypothetical protein